MASIKAKINSKDKLLEWCHSLVDFWDDHKYIQVTATDKRSLSANALQHEWYKIIANHYGCDESEIKDYCKCRFGAGILMRQDLEFADILKSIDWNQKAANWNMTVSDAKQLFISKMNVTSTFSTEESKEYMDAMKRHYESEGFNLPSKKDLAT
jgi:hypothetical protein